MLMYYLYYQLVVLVLAILFTILDHRDGQRYTKKQWQTAAFLTFTPVINLIVPYTALVELWEALLTKLDKRN
jgi:hypothetical protein